MGYLITMKHDDLGNMVMEWSYNQPFYDLGMAEHGVYP